MRKLVLFLAGALGLSGCAAAVQPPQTPQELSALARARNLHWVVETRAGEFIGSATAFGPGRLLTSRHVVQDWIGLPLRVRQGSVVHPLQRFDLAVRQDVAVLHIAARDIPAPEAAERPEVNDRLLVAGASRHGTLDGAGIVIPPIDGVKENDDDYITARLPVLSGFSGGPVVDTEGRLVGITTAAVIRRNIDSPDTIHADRSMAVNHRAALVLSSAVVRNVLRAEGLD